MGLTGATNEERIWNYLVGKGLSAAGAAGLLGNLYAESALNPRNLQNSYERSLGYTDDSYTAAVDRGAYANFAHDSAGYGLAQWTYWSRKQNMLEFARAAGKSIGDLEMQLDFLFKELVEGYKAVLAILKTAASVKAASDSVLVNFERPADQSSAAKTRRASYGQTYYDKYVDKASRPGNGGVNMTEQALRQKVVSIAQSYIGCKESDGSHRKIIDLYNSHKPLARGYAVKYTDAWCSTFASAVAIAAELTDIIPTECGCEKHIQLFKALGSWEENDAHVPSPGDYIFYDWQDGANYATTDNTGAADHIGIVEKVSGSTITVIEGNMSNAVGRRTLKVNGRYIRGYGVPKYSSKTSSTPDSSTGPATSTPSPGSYKVGDVVEFTGSKHYTSANAASGPVCKPGKAKITQIYQPDKSKHPYHLVAVSGGGSTVYGWVDAADIPAPASAGTASRTYTVKSGDSLWAIAAKQLGNGSRYEEIKRLNGLSSNTIHAGQVLKLPE